MHVILNVQLSAANPNYVMRRAMQKLGGSVWHIRRVSQPQNVFFELRLVLRKDAPKLSPNFLSLYYLVGLKYPIKVSAKIPL